MFNRKYIQFTYLIFFIWWCYHSLVVFPGYQEESKFFVAPSLYSLLVVVSLFFTKKGSISPPKGINLMFFWVLLESLLELLGNTVSFKIRILSLFSHFVISYIVLLVFNKEIADSERWSGSFLLVLAVSSIALLFSGSYSSFPLDVLRFLIIYIPLYRVTVLCLMLLMILRVGLDETSLWKISLGFYFVFALLSELVFIEGFMVGSGLAKDSHSFLILTGYFFFFWGVNWLLDNPLSVFNLRKQGITYFRTVKQKIPVSLN